MKQSATAVGYGWLRRLFRVELPLAMPVIYAGLRVVTVSNIALVSVAVLIGSGALGKLFDLGFGSFFYTPIIVASGADVGIGAGRGCADLAHSAWHAALVQEAAHGMNIFRVSD